MGRPKEEMVHLRAPLLLAFFAVFGLVMSWTVSSMAAPQVPVALQGAILAKALHYDQSLSAEPKIVILAGAGDAADAAVLAKAFSALRGTAEIASATDVSSRIKGAGAIYVFPGLLSDAVRTLCVSHRVISLAGSSGEALAGMASISVDIAGGKPQIIVHLPRSKAEGHKLSSRLLKLARVVQ